MYINAFVVLYRFNKLTIQFYMRYLYHCLANWIGKMLPNDKNLLPLNLWIPLVSHLDRVKVKT